MCSRKLALSLLFLGVCSLGFSQSFEDSKVYQVQGSWLNERQKESKIANEALTNSKEENERLKKLSDDREAKLTEVSRQLSEALTLTKNLQNQRMAELVGVGCAAAITFFFLGWLTGFQ